MSHDPRPSDPRRLELLSSVESKHDENGLLRVTVTYIYNEWCCGGVHEVADALQGIANILEEAQDRIARAENEELRRDLGLD